MRQRVLLAAVCGVLLAVAACGGEKPKAPAPTTPAKPPPAAPEPVLFDPPGRFQSSGQRLAKAPRRADDFGAPQVAAVLIDQSVVYVDGATLAGRDVVSGDEEWVTNMPGVSSAEASVVTTPVLFEGRVYVAAAITITGSTRVTGYRAISLAALDPQTGAVIWSATIDAIPGDPVQDVRLVGVTLDSIVVDTSTTTYVVDAQTRRTRWKVQYFEPTVVDGTVVAGQLGDEATETRTSTVGLRLTDGVQLWKSETPLQQGRSFPLGPGLMGVQGREFTSADAYFDFVDPVTGASRYSGDPADLRAFESCWFDARTTVVCSGTATTPVVVGYNASDLREIWQLPVGERRAPRVTAAWHGAVYGLLSDKPTTLDGRTGAIRGTNAGAAPELVNEYAGVSAASGSLTLFLAVG
ncbi:PQQ-binding-like beta-propeller repeat protein [Cryptosporangium sp. NPDC048952]|uniref:outer membrane protein assembly factor BamB family protein n=1 Tax=Cryptosporangium sp. NPDC048952 TaxID=3363961 RepID=UPI0037107694